MLGEVRGAEALELLKAWNTGNPGGVATVHANSSTDALPSVQGLGPDGELLVESIADPPDPEENPE